VWARLLQSAWRTFLSGLATVLPVALTIYVVAWLLHAAESAFGGLARVILPHGWYLPGTGVLLAVVLVFAVGAFLNAWLVGRLIGLGERVLERIPFVKTVYTGIRDLTRFLSRSGEGEARRVVSVEIQPDAHVIGFVTDDDAGAGLPELAEEGSERLVAVYLPMGYQVGGYTLYLPASRLTPLDLTVEEAMRVVLTAGVNRPRRGSG